MGGTLWPCAAGQLVSAALQMLSSRLSCILICRSRIGSHQLTPISLPADSLLALYCRCCEAQYVMSRPGCTETHTSCCSELRQGVFSCCAGGWPQVHFFCPRHSSCVSQSMACWWPLRGTNHFCVCLLPHQVTSAPSGDFALRLQVAGVKVELFCHNLFHGTPDAVFPNNWFSTHPAAEAQGSLQRSTLVLYPMKHASRRHERRDQIIAVLRNRGYSHLFDM